MSNKGKNILAVQDISCYSVCSMTAVVPMLTRFGHRVTPLPTALLSTQTGCYTDFSFLDLTSEMEKIIAHWEKLSLSFDALFSGFLGSARQIDLVTLLADRFLASDGFALIDPVMGDNGRIYQTYSEEMCEGMKRLCEKGDLITPNLTEAYILLGREYDPRPDEKKLRELLHSLLSLGKKKDFSVVITGVLSPDGRGIGVWGEKKGSEVFSHYAPVTDEFFPGVGDIYASCLLGRLANGESLAQAASRSADYVSCAAKYTKSKGAIPREGLLINEVPID